MIWLAALDPATLALWYDPGLVVRGPEGNIIAEAIHHAIFGNIADVYRIILSIKDPVARTRCLYLVSTVWHEQRHFFDLILTNYGAFRFRQFLSIYLNTTNILNEFYQSKAPIVFPIEVYNDSVSRRIYGITSTSIELSDALQQIGKNISERDEMLRFDRETTNSRIGSVEVGGNAQLETIAYLCQFGALQTYFGMDAALEAQYLAVSTNDVLAQKYSWPANLFREHFGIDVVGHGRNGLPLIDGSIVIPILIGSLAIRVWGQKITSDDIARPSFSSGRLLGFIEELSQKGDKIRGLSILKMWELVNEISERRWGRTVLEEIQEDYKYETDFYKQIANIKIVPDTIKNSFREFHTLRGSLIQLLEHSPEVILDPILYAQQVLPRVLPIPIFASPQGQFGDPPEGWSRLLGYQHANQDGPTSKFWWAAVPELWSNENGQLLAFEALETWTPIMDFYAPIAKMMIKGRNHRIMLGPEVLRAEGVLNTEGIETKYASPFDFPQTKVMPAESIYNISGLNELKCDFCLRELTRPEGHMISPWAFRSNHLAAHKVINAYGGGDSGLNEMIRDWSVWVVCDECLNAMQRDGAL